jgi:hypothetical protein
MTSNQERNVRISGLNLLLKDDATPDLTGNVGDSNWAQTMMRNSIETVDKSVLMMDSLFNSLRTSMSETIETIDSRGWEYNKRVSMCETIETIDVVGSKAFYCHPSTGACASDIESTVFDNSFSDSSQDSSNLSVGTVDTCLECFAAEFTTNTTNNDNNNSTRPTDDNEIENALETVGAIDDMNEMFKILLQESRGAETNGTVSNEDVRPHDVLLGRGRSMRTHPGNAHFRKLVAASFDVYCAVDRTQKTKVAEAIIEVIQRYGGRFLKQTASSPAKGCRGASFWEEIGHGEARYKVAHTFRGVRKQRQQQKERAK